VNFVLIQDLLIGLTNITIDFIELDTYPANHNLVYMAISIPIIQTLVTFMILMFKYEMLKTNSYAMWMDRHRLLR
jgi:hypothetical protein